MSRRNSIPVWGHRTTNMESCHKHLIGHIHTKIINSTFQQSGEFPQAVNHQYNNQWQMGHRLRGVLIGSTMNPPHHRSQRHILILIPNCIWSPWQCHKRGQAAHRLSSRSTSLSLHSTCPRTMAAPPQSPNTPIPQSCSCIPSAHKQSQHRQTLINPF